MTYYKKYILTNFQIIEIHDLINKHKKHLCKLEINDIHIHVSFLHKQLNRLQSQLINNNIPFPTLDCYFDRSNIGSNRIFNNISQYLDKKLNDLLKHKTLHSNI